MTNAELKREVHEIICTRNLEPDDWCKEAENDMLKVIEERVKEAYLFGRELMYHSENCGSICNHSEIVRKADMLSVDNAFNLWNKI